MSLLFLRHFDPALPLTTGERWRVYRLAWKRQELKRMLCLFVGSLVILGVTILVNHRLIGRSNPLRLDPMWFSLLTAYMPPVLIWWVAYPCWGIGVSIRQILREQGYDVCMRCGYWLRGLEDDVRRCPECGVRREPMPVPPMEYDD